MQSIVAECPWLRMRFANVAAATMLGVVVEAHGTLVGEASCRDVMFV